MYLYVYPAAVIQFLTMILLDLLRKVEVFLYTDEIVQMFILIKIRNVLLMYSGKVQHIVPKNIIWIWKFAVMIALDYKTKKCKSLMKHKRKSHQVVVEQIKTKLLISI